MVLDDRTSNLLFLLSLSPLVAGCPAGDDTSSGETAGTTGTPMTTGSTGTPMTGDSTGTPMTSDGSGTGSTGVATTDADSTTSAGETEGLVCDGEPPPLMGEIDPLCVSFTEFYNECEYGVELPQECVDLYSAYCQYYLEDYITMYGEACGMAVLEYYACLTMLTCQEFEEMVSPCSEQGDAIDATCVVE